MSLDRTEIMASPLAQHPTLKPIAARLAEDPKMTAGRAEQLLAIAANTLGLTQLDIEMCQSANDCFVPWGVAPSGRPDDFGTLVINEVKRLNAQSVPLPPR